MTTATTPLLRSLEQLLDQFRPMTVGEVASYIPELTRADPEHFGIAVATVDGHVYEVGDSGVEFTIQSISKPFMFGLALDDLGAEEVLRRVGVEPSGDAFNAISLEAGTGRPRNPMINAGAIATAGMIAGDCGIGPFERALATMSSYAGRALAVDEAVFESERETGHRNRAIGHLLRSAGVLEGEVDEVCDRYFRQCSVRVTSRDLAMMAATLANSGVNPVTGDRAIQSTNVHRILSVMSTCGMYDSAGSWLYRVGIPAKSGVGGGVVAVLPGQLGIGVFSPRLDSFGNSVRGVATCEALSREFGLHLLRPPISVDMGIRSIHPLSALPSKRQRTPAEMACIDDAGNRARVIQLQGPLVLTTVEMAIRAVARVGAGGIVAIDLRRATGLDGAVGRLLGVFASSVAGEGGRTVFAGRPAEHPSVDLVRQHVAPEAGGRVWFVESLDDALELCESLLLAAAGVQVEPTEQMAISEHPMLAALDGGERGNLADLLQQRTAVQGDWIVRQGDEPDALYLLTGGLVEARVGVAEGRTHRLATLGPGATFGEMALADSQPRSADIVAATDCVFYELSLDALEAAAAASPSLHRKVLAYLARDLAARLRRADREIAALIA